MKISKLSFLLIGGVLSIVIIYAGLLLFITWPISEWSINKSGVFGDSFGVLTSLFSGLAFAGLIITIIMQKDELALQREELSLTREELSGQKEELKIQNETMKKQQFENTFFQMLSLHSEIVKNISISNINLPSQKYNKYDAFKHLHDFFKKKLSTRKPEKISRLYINNMYLNHIYDNYKNQFGIYFRNLYNIIKFIDGSNVDDKKTYTNLLRAQLSDYELLLLFYNCLSDMGYEKFKPLVEKYSLLKALPDEAINHPEEQKTLYAPSAFGNPPT